MVDDFIFLSPDFTGGYLSLNEYQHCMTHLKTNPNIYYMPWFVKQYLLNCSSKTNLSLKPGVSHSESMGYTEDEKHIFQSPTSMHFN